QDTADSRAVARSLSVQDSLEERCVTGGGDAGREVRKGSLTGILAEKLGATEKLVPRHENACRVLHGAFEGRRSDTQQDITEVVRGFSNSTVYRLGIVDLRVGR